MYIIYPADAFTAVIMGLKCLHYLCFLLVGIGLYCKTLRMQACVYPMMTAAVVLIPDESNGLFMENVIITHLKIVG